MTQGASNEEAAWRQLVAQFGEPAGTDGSYVPWPAREDLPVPFPTDRSADPADTDEVNTFDLMLHTRSSRQRRFEKTGAPIPTK